VSGNRTAKEQTLLDTWSALIAVSKATHSIGAGRGAIAVPITVEDVMYPLEVTLARCDAYRCASEFAENFFTPYAIMSKVYRDTGFRKKRQHG